MSCPHVVEHDEKPSGPQQVDEGPYLSHVLDFGLEDFNGERAWFESGHRDELVDLVRQGCRRLRDRYMHIQEQHVVARVGAQSGKCADGLLAAQLIQFVDEAGLAGRVEECPRSDHPGVHADAARQRLEAHNRPPPREQDRLEST